MSLQEASGALQVNTSSNSALGLSKVSTTPWDPRTVVGGISGYDRKVWRVEGGGSWREEKTALI